MFVFLLVFWYLYLEENYLVPGRLRNLEHHLVALELAGEIGSGMMMMEQAMIMTMIVDGEDNHEDDDSDDHGNDSG